MSKTFNRQCVDFIRLSALVMLMALGWVASMASAQSPPPLAHQDLGLRVEGVVNAIAVQPDGGVIFGGIFSSVNGIARANIARRLPGGGLDPDWAPAVAGDVRHLASDGSGAVYVAGAFTLIGGVERSWIAKLAVPALGWSIPAGKFPFKKGRFPSRRSARWQSPMPASFT